MGLGSFHGADVAYVFGRIEVGERYTSDDKELARQMRQYWIHFCRTGDPNSKHLPSWPRFKSSDEAFLILDTPIGRGTRWRVEASEFIETCWRN